MKQEEAFLKGEGDAYYYRNKNKPKPLRDPVIEAILTHGIKPTSILEYGCGTGARLIDLSKRFGCTCVGVDPSWAAAAEDPNHRRELAAANVHVFQGTALSFAAKEYDLVIYGFCLYLCDREDLFKIAANGDHSLAEGGHLIIHDFVAPPHSRVYEHRPELRSYKMDYSRLWSWNPAYRHVYGVWPASPDEDVVSILKKEMSTAWPLKP